MRLLCHFYPPYEIARSLLIFLGIGICSMSNPICAASERTLRTMPLAELEGELVDSNPKTLSCRLEGTVRAVAPNSCVLALQDFSETALLELPAISPEVTNGKRVVWVDSPLIKEAGD
jgi:hypothetical protein